MNNMLRNGRALQLEKLQYARNKVTLGFKCDASTKIELAQEANQNGMTLSEYVETVISLRHHEPPASSKKYSYNEFESKLLNAKKQAEAIQTHLDFYERNPKLQALFNKYKGVTTTYINMKGDEQEIVINQITDLYLVLVHSFNA